MAETRDIAVLRGHLHQGVFARPTKRHERVGVANGHNLEQVAIRGGEYRRIRAQANSEGEHGHGRKPGTATQPPRRIPHVARDVLQPRQKLHVTARFAETQLVTELTARQCLRRFTGHPCCDQILNARFDVKRDFLVELAVDAVGAKQVRDARQPGHG
jgi:hypothetical protein